jgi:hypothetical protein
MILGYANYHVGKLGLLTIGFLSVLVLNGMFFLIRKSEPDLPPTPAERCTKKFISLPLTGATSGETEARARMKMRTHFQPARIVLLVVLATFLFTNGCTMVRSESDVLGEYELKVGTGKIELKILPDKSFSERIFWSTGKVENRSGKWVWTENGIGFDQLWIPPEFAPDYILRADAEATANRQPKYTEPGYSWGRPEKHWGTVMIPIFPDADVRFQMIRKFHRP